MTQYVAVIRAFPYANCDRLWLYQYSYSVLCTKVRHASLKCHKNNERWMMKRDWWTAAFINWLVDVGIRHNSGTVHVCCCCRCLSTEYGDFLASGAWELFIRIPVCFSNRFNKSHIPSGLFPYYPRPLVAVNNPFFFCTAGTKRLN